MRLRSLRSLTLAFFLVFLLATIGTGVATYAASRWAVVRLVDQRVAAVSDAVLQPGTDAGAHTLLARMEAIGNDRDTGDIGLMLLAPDGRRLGGNVALRRVLPIGYSAIDAVDGIPGLPSGRALVRQAPSGLRLVTIAETEPIDRYRTARLWIYVAGFGSIIVIVVGGVGFFSALVHRRIAELRRTADAIFDGDMLQRLPVAGAGGEFAQQAASFNRMLDRIAELMEGIANVSNDIAHDLRTPLARLRGQLTLLGRAVADPETRRQAEAAIAQCDTLLAMFAANLRIVEVEAGDRRAGFAFVDLADLLTDIEETMQPVATASGHILQLGPIDRSTVIGDRQLLGQALINLSDNALRHTPAATRITLSTAREEDRVLIRIADDGPGIPADDRARALRRFGRLDRSRSQPGHGLGLPLVDAIARLHHGTLILSDAGPGLCATLDLPLSAAAGT